MKFKIFEKVKMSSNVVVTKYLILAAEGGITRFSAS